MSTESTSPLIGFAAFWALHLVAIHWLTGNCEANAEKRSWRGCAVSPRQRYDMVLLAHIREQHHHSLGSYGRPRMTQELNEIGLSVGHRRVGHLMRQNGIQVVRTRKYKGNDRQQPQIQYRAQLAGPELRS